MSVEDLNFALDVFQKQALRVNHSPLEAIHGCEDLRSSLLRQIKCSECCFWVGLWWGVVGKLIEFDCL